MENVYLQEDDSTIAAIVTGKGQAGVGIVRVSGILAKNIAEKITGLKDIQAKQVYFTKFKQASGTLIDEGLLLYFKAPNSFTGEDVVEFQGHGGVVVLNTLLEEIINLGARQAVAGEFSSRAFFNNKIDLVQAEAIADLIAAETKASASSAINSLQGVFSKQVDNLVNKFIELRIFVEASIDFSDEDIDFLEDSDIMNRLKNLEKELRHIIEKTEQGIKLQQGLNVVLTGEPNVGKSSLLNQLTGLDSAIVTDIEGTTRDIVKEVIYIKGMPIKIFDTAGLRDTDNSIEAEGIKRAKQALKTADKIFWLTDKNDFSIDTKLISEKEQKNLIDENKLIFIRNKIDLSNEQAEVVKKNNQMPTVIKISAKHNIGIDSLLEFLEQDISNQLVGEDVFSARTRHINSLKIAYTYIVDLLYKNTDLNTELFAEDLRLIQRELETITGKFSNEELLTRIFSGFCIGK